MMKKINNILIFIISFLSIFVFIRDLKLESYDRLISSLSMFLVLFIPRIISKISKIKISSGMEFVYIIFVFLAQFVGSCLNLYNKTSWYDLFMHFTSGVLVSILSLNVLSWFGLYNDKNKVFNVLFIVCFSLFIASCWEFLEYGADYFLKLNVQHSKETGVKDTMEDMLISFLGTIIICFTYLFEGKKGYIKRIVSDLN